MMFAKFYAVFLVLVLAIGRTTETDIADFEYDSTVERRQTSTNSENIKNVEKKKPVQNIAKYIKYNLQSTVPDTYDASTTLDDVVDDYKNREMLLMENTESEPISTQNDLHTKKITNKLKFVDEEKDLDPIILHEQETETTKVQQIEFFEDLDQTLTDVIYPQSTTSQELYETIDSALYGQGTKQNRRFGENENDIIDMDYRLTTAADLKKQWKDTDAYLEIYEDTATTKNIVENNKENLDIKNTNKKVPHRTSNVTNVFDLIFNALETDFKGDTTTKWPITEYLTRSRQELPVARTLSPEERNGVKDVLRQLLPGHDLDKIMTSTFANTNPTTVWVTVRDIISDILNKIEAEKTEKSKTESTEKPTRNQIDETIKDYKIVPSTDTDINYYYSDESTKATTKPLISETNNYDTNATHILNKDDTTLNDEENDEILKENSDLELSPSETATSTDEASDSKLKSLLDDADTSDEKTESNTLQLLSAKAEIAQTVKDDGKREQNYGDEISKLILITPLRTRDKISGRTYNDVIYEQTATASMQDLITTNVDLDYDIATVETLQTIATTEKSTLITNDDDGFTMQDRPLKDDDNPKSLSNSYRPIDEVNIIPLNTDRLDTLVYRVAISSQPELSSAKKETRSKLKLSSVEGASRSKQKLYDDTLTIETLQMTATTEASTLITQDYDETQTQNLIMEHNPLKVDNLQPGLSSAKKATRSRLKLSSIEGATHSKLKLSSVKRVSRSNLKLLYPSRSKIKPSSARGATHSKLESLSAVADTETESTLFSTETGISSGQYYYDETNSKNIKNVEKKKPVQNIAEYIKYNLQSTVPDTYDASTTLDDLVDDYKNREMLLMENTESEPISTQNDLHTKKITNKLKSVEEEKDLDPTVLHEQETEKTKVEQTEFFVDLDETLADVIYPQSTTPKELYETFENALYDYATKQYRRIGENENDILDMDYRLTTTADLEKQWKDTDAYLENIEDTTTTNNIGDSNKEDIVKKYMKMKFLHRTSNVTNVFDLIFNALETDYTSDDYVSTLDYASTIPMSAKMDRRWMINTGQKKYERRTKIHSKTRKSKWEKLKLPIRPDTMWWNWLVQALMDGWKYGGRPTTTPTTNTTTKVNITKPKLLNTLARVAVNKPYRPHLGWARFVTVERRKNKVGLKEKAEEEDDFKEAANKDLRKGGVDTATPRSERRTKMHSRTKKPKIVKLRLKALMDRHTRRRKTSSTTPSTTPPVNIPRLLGIISNLSDEFVDDMINTLNESLQNLGIPTCPEVAPASVVIPTWTPTTYNPYENLTGTIMGKCFVCGLREPKIPSNTRCSDAFASEFLPLTPVDPTARSQIARYRKYCRWKNIAKYWVNNSDTRSLWGRWTGGCGVRWTDVSSQYTERVCRNRHRAIMGRSFASKRMAKLEMALQHLDNGCIMSPVASLIPMSRGISLYARFTACVCTGSWCNMATSCTQWSPFSELISFFILLLQHFVMRNG